MYSLGLWSQRRHLRVLHLSDCTICHHPAGCELSGHPIVSIASAGEGGRDLEPASSSQKWLCESRRTLREVAAYGKVLLTLVSVLPSPSSLLRLRDT